MDTTDTPTAMAAARTLAHHRDGDAHSGIIFYPETEIRWTYSPGSGMLHAQARSFQLSATPEAWDAFLAAATQALDDVPAADAPATEAAA